MAQTFICNCCDKEISSKLHLAHVPFCYYTSCKEAGIEPYCTCPQCKGKKTHDSSPSLAEEIGVNSRKRKSGISPQISPTQTTVETPLLQGKNCLSCNQYRSPSSVSLPYIFIGSYRTAMICKKQHITVASDFRAIEKILEEELKIVQTEGDTPFSVTIEGSQDEKVCVFL
jgi:hypothetical protein